MTTIEARRQTKRGRFYEVDGKLYPSVTTILTAIGKPALVAWAAREEREMVLEESAALFMDKGLTAKMDKPETWKMYLTTRLGATQQGQKKMRKAGEIGTLTHSLIENELNKRMGLPFKELATMPASLVPEPVLMAFNHWLDWASSVHLEPIASEQVIWSHQHRFAGTLDLLARINGKLSVVDWKTGKYVYNEAHLQNAAYRHAIREMGHGDPECGYIVRLPKVADDPKFEAVEADAEAPSMEVFLNVQKLWLWQEEKQAAWEASCSG